MTALSIGIFGVLPKQYHCYNNSLMLNIDEMFTLQGACTSEGYSDLQQ